MRESPLSVQFRFSALSITGFRGIRELGLELPEGVPTYLVGPNNAGKSTVLLALAFALKGGGSHSFSPEPHDFYHHPDGTTESEFLIELAFEATGSGVLPAVQGVGNPVDVHGARVLGRTTRNGRLEHRHVLYDSAREAITLSPRTALKGEAKDRYKDHGLGWARYYARLDDIRDHLPEVWLLTPENLSRSLYTWQTGPLQRLAKLLTDEFLQTEWSFKYEGVQRNMPSTLEAAHRFFRACVAEFPFWKDDMKPRLEAALGTYLGRSAKFGLAPDVLVLEEWLKQQLAVSFAGESNGALVPLPRMGDGWQALVRLAALEVLESYATPAPTPVMLLCEEPEVFLHPHLRRKLRHVLSGLASKGWLVVSATHGTEFLAFHEPQQIVRLWRSDAGTSRGQVLTQALPEGPKHQSRLDERGNQELFLANRVVLCEGKDDAFALRLFLEKADTDLDGRGVTLLDVGGCGNEPDYARICKNLGIPWCGLTDEDLLPDGTIKPATATARQQLQNELTSADIMPIWEGSLEACLGKTNGKADSKWQSMAIAPKSLTELQRDFPSFARTADTIRVWIER